jgi:hypothetical protein
MTVFIVAVVVFVTKFPFTLSTEYGDQKWIDHINILIYPLSVRSSVRI